MMFTKCYVLILRPVWLSNCKPGRHTLKPEVNYKTASLGRDLDQNPKSKVLGLKLSCFTRWWYHWVNSRIYSVAWCRLGGSLWQNSGGHNAGTGSMPNDVKQPGPCRILKDSCYIVLLRLAGKPKQEDCHWHSAESIKKADTFVGKRWITLVNGSRMAG